MAIDRRTFLVGGVIALAGVPPSGAAANASDVFASACRRRDGGYGIALVDAGGRVVAELALAGRAHDIAWSAKAGVAVAFARQPGRFALAFSPSGAREAQLFAPPDDRCFFGHGVFSPGGRLLYATENGLDDGIGHIGIYDVGASFSRIGELSSGGIGPHEILLLADGRTLVVANGGYETLPDSGRQPIDIAGMQPSLVFLDRSGGDVKAHHVPQPTLRALSIRHLAADGRGRVWFGGQWEGNADATPEVIGSASLDRALALVEPERPIGRSLKGYVGSVVMGRDGRTLAASAPRAGRTVLIDVETGALRSVIALADGCGVAAISGGFAVSSGHGVLIAHRDGQPDATMAELPGVAFDNHLRLLGQV